MNKRLAYLILFLGCSSLIVFFDFITGHFNEITIKEVILAVLISIVASFFLTWLDEKDNAIIPYTKKEILNIGLFYKFVFYFAVVAILDFIINPSMLKPEEFLEPQNLLHNSTLTIMLIFLKIIQGKKTDSKILV